jgi:hypothetical protein
MNALVLLSLHLHLVTAALVRCEHVYNWRDSIALNSESKINPFCQEGNDCVRFVEYRPTLSLQEVYDDGLDGTAGGMDAYGSGVDKKPLLVVVKGIDKTSMKQRPKPLEDDWISSSGAEVQEHGGIGLSMGSLHRLGQALESHLTSGSLPNFHIETRYFPHCHSQGGPCAIWEAGSGRIVLHTGLLLPSSDDTDTDAWPNLLESLVESFSIYVSTPNMSRWNGLNRNWDRRQQTAHLEDATHFALRDVFNKKVRMPLWWCLACPIALGTLVPLVLNYGLTEIADEVCISLDLSEQECADLWWGAFSLALVLSLGSAIPIVYACRLPECGP